MPSSTLCFTGFSREDLAKAQQLFAQANAETGGRFELAPEADARVLVIDMDSMYGHMTWLKASGSGKTTVGLTAGERCETDFMIKSPLSAEGMRGMLAQLGAGEPAREPASAPAAAPAPPQAPTPGASIVAAAAAARNTGQQPAMPRTTGQQAARPRTTGQQAAMPRTTGQQAALPPEEGNKGIANEYLAAMTTGQMAAMGPVVPHEPRISDYLTGNAVRVPVKLQLPGSPVLALDPATGSYGGSATLKPLLPYVDAIIGVGQLEAIDEAEFQRIAKASGGAQPYMRLLWLCGLTVGAGQLLPGYAAGKKYLLTKWPQIEREYPKHFRLATVMMKGPATVRDIAEQAGVSEAEAVDFVNAGLVTGAVVVEGTVTATGDVPKAVALLAKPRPA